MRELREDTFSGNKDKDAHDHIDRVLSIVGLFNILGVSKDAVMLRVFPFILTGAAKRWVDRLAPGTINTWDLLKKSFIQRHESGSIPINRGLIQAILTSLPPQPIGEATKASNLRRIPPGVQGRSHFTYFLYLIVQIRILRSHALSFSLYSYRIHKKVGGRTRPRNNQYLGSPQKAFIQRYCSPSMTAKQLEDIHKFKQEGDESLYQAWERNIRSSSSKDGLAALVNKLDNLGRDMKKLKESVHAIQVGCQIYEGPHLDKDCPLNVGEKQVEEVRYGEFRRTTPFNEYNGGNFRVGPPGYYTKTDNRPPYGERRQRLEELLAKHQEESARRSTKMEVWIKKLQENVEINIRNQNASLKNLETQIEQLTEELRSRKEKSEQPKVVTVEHEGPSSLKKIKNLHGISFLFDSREENTNDQLHTKESNPGHFMLPCTIGNFNFYAMADLGASVNVLPRNIFEYLELTNLSETEMLVEMADMRKKAPLGIVRDILVKIDKFLFPSDFVILDQTPNSTVILGRPFLATVHAQISVFEKEISVGIGDERVTFNINRNDPNFAPTEGIFMLNSINADEPITKRLKISDDTATTHFCKPIIQECDKDFKAWPSCSPFMNKCDGGMKFTRSISLVEDSVWSKRYSEWCNENSHDKKPRPRDYTFKEWVKLKKGHLDISKSVRKDLFRSWVIDQFTEALDPDKNPLERCLDEYNWVFHKEIEQLADEYEIKIREKGQVLEEIWTKCKRARCKNKDWWYDYWYEDEEKTKLGNEDYDPPMVHTETFEVTKYKFNNGCSFICVNGENSETLSLGRKNGSRFRKMIMEEMEEVLGNDGEDSDNET
ncbi:reverse transcriptase domain-containing protein [Tanacetum coccineum]|uniref:Reverse transcriptase domain-containing protein n=1 Tax=Tanacetum coccineum TaxID=301880 RepID=A0ABQ5I675_9ASTR